MTPGAPDDVTGSGSPVATLSAFADGEAEQTFEASGAAVATLSAFADGEAEQTFEASGSPTATLSATAAGVAEQTFEASGSPVATLSATASGTAFSDDDTTASGAATTSLSAFASGAATMTPAPRTRRARGFLIVEDAEREEKEDEPEAPAVVEADPLPTLIDIPAVELAEFNRAQWQSILTRSHVPPRPKKLQVPVEIELGEPEIEFVEPLEDDDEDLLEILALL
jgi:hypothetical protein